LKKSAFGTAILLAAGLTMASVPAATAAQSPAPKVAVSDVNQSLEQAREFLTIYKVTAETQERLVAKYQRGETWDSLNGATPVDTQTVEKTGKTETVSRFADGSVNVTSIQKPAAAPQEGEITTRGISECGYYRVGATENYDNCLVDFWAGLVYMGFRADYSAVDNNVDYIRSIYSPDYIIGGASSAEQTEFAVTREYETPGAPATARLTVLAYPAGTPFAFNFWVQLNVGFGGAYMTYSS